VSTGYLSGGTALSGYLGHRSSLDVDLFVGEALDVDVAASMLLHHASGAGWAVEELRRSPGFRRFRVSCGGDSTLVDIVHEVVPQLVPLAEKPVHDGLRVDSLDDLVANKLCAVLGRSEVKDLVDLYFLEESGVDVLAYLRAARGKDGGMEPATLGFVLGQMPTDPVGLNLLKPLSEDQLAEFRDRLVAALVRIAWPGP
jgi:hypothetical protein